MPARRKRKVVEAMAVAGTTTTSIETEFMFGIDPNKSLESLKQHLLVSKLPADEIILCGSLVKNEQQQQQQGSKNAITSSTPAINNPITANTTKSTDASSSGWHTITPVAATPTESKSKLTTKVDAFNIIDTNSECSSSSSGWHMKGTWQYNAMNSKPQAFGYSPGPLSPRFASKAAEELTGTEEVELPVSGRWAGGFDLANDAKGMHFTAVAEAVVFYFERQTITTTQDTSTAEPTPKRTKSSTHDVVTNEQPIDSTSTISTAAPADDTETTATTAPTSEAPTSPLASATPTASSTTTWIVQGEGSNQYGDFVINGKVDVATGSFSGTKVYLLRRRPKVNPELGGLRSSKRKREPNRMLDRANWASQSAAAAVGLVGTTGMADEPADTGAIADVAIGIGSNSNAINESEKAAPVVSTTAAAAAAVSGTKGNKSKVSRKANKNSQGDVPRVRLKPGPKPKPKPGDPNYVPPIGGVGGSNSKNGINTSKKRRRSSGGGSASGKQPKGSLSRMGSKLSMGSGSTSSEGGGGVGQNKKNGAKGAAPAASSSSSSSAVVAKGVTSSGKTLTVKLPQRAAKKLTNVGQEWSKATVDDSGEVYEGSYFDGERCGYGTCGFPTGELYEGEWMDGREQGRGRITDINGALVYQGEFADGRIHGKGTYFFANGDRYDGEWREGTRNGYGIYRTADGVVYEGEWVRSKRQGQGLSAGSDGSTYEGEWSNDARHGKGIVRLFNGLVFDGTFKSNRPEGRGVCVYPDKSRYEGVWRNGHKNGRGTFVFTNGAMYEGRFKDDKIHGTGTLKMKDGVPVNVKPEQWIVPVDCQQELRFVHLKAGFNVDGL